MADEIFLPSTLHVKPEAIPAVRAAIQKSLAELSPELVQLGMDGLLGMPWLTDPVSVRAMEHYNEVVMHRETGLYHGLLAYERQLKAAVAALDDAERRYEQGEQDQTRLVLRFT